MYYTIILYYTPDFRDTFFQRNPFETLPPIETRPAAGVYDLRVYAENDKVRVYVSLVE